MKITSSDNITKYVKAATKERAKNKEIIDQVII